MKRRARLASLSLVAALALGTAPAPVDAVVPGIPGKIIYSDYGSNGNQWEIYSMNADGSGKVNLSNDSADDWYPAVSPDGAHIAFETHRDGNGEIYVMDIDGSDQTRLTTTAANESQPTWSPDGTKIAYSKDPGGNWDVWVMNADGSSPMNLSNAASTDQRPDWSPGGTKIAFESDRDGNYEIYVMNADGSGPVRLTNNSAGDWGPRWSPDGTRIAFSTERDGNMEIYTMNADGTSPVNLTNSTAWDGAPAWSPGSSKMAFTSNRAAGDMDVWKMNADGSSPANVSASNAGGEDQPSWQGTAAKPDALVKLASSDTYKGDGVYNLTGTGQAAVAKVVPGKKAVINVTVQNDATVDDWHLWGGCRSSKGFRVTYLAGTLDFTQEAKNGGLLVGPVPPGTGGSFRVLIKALPTVTPGAVKTCLITGTSDWDPGAQDAVKATVKVTR